MKNGGKMMKTRLLSMLLVVCMVLSMIPMTVLADDAPEAAAMAYNIEDGDITIRTTADGQTTVQVGSADAVVDNAPVITGTTSQYSLTIHVDAGQTSAVTLKDLNIDRSKTGQDQDISVDHQYRFGKAGIELNGEGDVLFELDGTNSAKGGVFRAGVLKYSTGRLTIQDENGVPGSLEAVGGHMGAGIGGTDSLNGEDWGNGSHITINSGTIIATGGDGHIWKGAGAGIGGGGRSDNRGAGSDITINGGTVIATGGSGLNTRPGAAGIGGGGFSTGHDITINGGNVTAKGGAYGGAGIGGTRGYRIKITDGNVTAIGGYEAAGIGGGGSGFGIEISGGTVVAVGGSGAGIGGGTGSERSVTEGTVAGAGCGITITGTAKVTAYGGMYGAGIGGGRWGDGGGTYTFEDVTYSGITINGNAKVTAFGGQYSLDYEGGGAGIGGGKEGSAGTITIGGNAVVKAYGGCNGNGSGGAGIGAGIRYETNKQELGFDKISIVDNALVCAYAQRLANAIGVGYAYFSKEPTTTPRQIEFGPDATVYMFTNRPTYESAPMYAAFLGQNEDGTINEEFVTGGENLVWYTYTGDKVSGYPAAGTEIGVSTAGSSLKWKYTNDEQFQLLNADGSVAKELTYTPESPKNEYNKNQYIYVQPFQLANWAMIGTADMPVEYTVSYDLNGGTAADGVDYGPESVNSGDSVLTKAAPTKEGYIFTGWSVNADGTGTRYNAGTSFTPTGNVTLYAQWIDEETGPQDVYIFFQTVASDGATAIDAKDALYRLNFRYNYPVSGRWVTLGLFESAEVNKIGNRVASESERDAVAAELQENDFEKLQQFGGNIYFGPSNLDLNTLNQLEWTGLKIGNGTSNSYFDENGQEPKNIWKMDALLRFYNVQFDANANDEQIGTVLTGGYYIEGETIKIPDLARPGHVFAGWDVLDKDGNVIETIARPDDPTKLASYTVGAADVKLRAKWDSSEEAEDIVYLFFQTVGSDGTTQIEVDAKAHDRLNFRYNHTKNDSWATLGMFESSEVVKILTSPASDEELNAVAEELKANGYEKLVPFDGRAHGGPTELDENALSQLTWKDLFRGNGTSGSYTRDDGSELTNIWKMDAQLIFYHMQFDTNAEDVTLPEDEDPSGYYIKNETITLPVLSRPGYYFQGWDVLDADETVIETLGSDVTSYTVETIDATFRAKWAEGVTLSYDANVPEDETVDDMPSPAGAPKDQTQDGSDELFAAFEVSDLVPKREGYHFLGWFTSAEDGEAVTGRILVSEDTTLYAHWEENELEVVETPVIVPDGGTFTGEQTVEITCETEDAVIHYTTDGSTPDASSPIYEGPFVISDTTTVRAIAVKPGCEDSGIASATFTKKKSSTISGSIFIPSLPSTPKEKVVRFNTADHFAYVNGYPDGTVQPNGNITRAEVAAILYRIMDTSVARTYDCATSSFQDVARSDWYNSYVATLEKAGVIVDTETGGFFRPNEAITRAELAAMLAQFAEIKYADSYASDVSANHWAAKAIAICTKLGWINGYPDGTFRPDQKITRAELMAMINRALERTPSSTSDLLTGMKIWRDNANVNAWYYIDVQEATNAHTYTKSGSQETWTSLAN